jgi:DNA recombination-mediator protein A
MSAPAAMTATQLRYSQSGVSALVSPNGGPFAARENVWRAAFRIRRRHPDGFVRHHAGGLLSEAVKPENTTGGDTKRAAEKGCQEQVSVEPAAGQDFYDKPKTFAIKKALREIDAEPERMLVLSQFPPRQTWNTGSAMTRNGVIAALGRALVVIEARERGGTLDAGLQALRMHRPLLALDFSGGAPVGNELLFARGARRIATAGELKRVLDVIGDPSEQLALEVGSP